MKSLLVALGAMVACGGPRVPAAIPIWPRAAPDALPSTEPERETTAPKPVAGRSWHAIENVARPTMTIYPPRGRATGAAVVVFPGGGYQELAIDLEGTEVCDWLTSEGITCVVLKYRVPDSGPHWDDRCKCHVTPPVPTALQDAQRTVGLVRARAAELHLDPHKIGVLGFSAGGHLVAAISTHFAQRAYPLVDAADRESCRPDFAIALYPGHLWTGKELELEPDIATHVTAQTSPTLLIQADDDDVDDVKHSLVYHRALEQAGVSVELHRFAHGGHAFGLRPTAEPITRWPALAMAWLKTIGMLGR